VRTGLHLLHTAASKSSRLVDFLSKQRAAADAVAHHLKDSWLLALKNHVR